MSIHEMTDEEFDGLEFTDQWQAELVVLNRLDADLAALRIAAERSPTANRAVLPAIRRVQAHVSEQIDATVESLDCERGAREAREARA